MVVLVGYIFGPLIFPASRETASCRKVRRASRDSRPDFEISGFG